MIYTIGHRDSYEEGLRTHGSEFRKLGKCVHNGAPYPGGAVFLHPGEAALDIADQPDYAVYGLIAHWHADTEQLAGEPFRRLLRDAQIVRP